MKSFSGFRGELSLGFKCVENETLKSFKNNILDIPQPIFYSAPPHATLFALDMLSTSPKCRINCFCQSSVIMRFTTEYSLNND